MRISADSLGCSRLGSAATHPDVAGSDERRLALEVFGVGDEALIVAGLEQEAGEVNLPAVDGVQQRRSSRRQALTEIRTRVTSF